MAETEINSAEEGQTPGTSRRSLLAKAAVGGAIIYAAPSIKSIPAYAAGGITGSVINSSDLACVWFSPNQNSKAGKWHADLASPTSIVSTTDSGSTQTMTVQVAVNGTNRAVTFAGSPVNQTGTLGKGSDGSGSYNYDGGGTYISIADSNCEIRIDRISVGKIDKASECSNQTSTIPQTWEYGSSDSSINGGAVAPSPSNVGGGNFQTAYYHSGCQGPDGAKKVLVAIHFKVACTN